jgi:hypothetical protein
MRPGIASFIPVGVLSAFDQPHNPALGRIADDAVEIVLAAVSRELVDAPLESRREADIELLGAAGLDAAGGLGGAVEGVKGLFARGRRANADAG